MASSKILLTGNFVQIRIEDEKISVRHHADPIRMAKVLGGVISMLSGSDPKLGGIDLFWLGQFVQHLSVIYKPDGLDAGRDAAWISALSQDALETARCIVRVIESTPDDEEQVQ